MIALSFAAPTGCYDLSFEPIEDTSISVNHGGKSMVWHIDVANGEKVRGMTRGAREIWGNEFWFELHTGTPATISYYGDRVLVRTDKEAS